MYMYPDEVGERGGIPMMLSKSKVHGSIESFESVHGVSLKGFIKLKPTLRS